VAQETREIVKYTVRQGDSLERLALVSMKDAESWLQLALLNGLDYPYITDDTSFARSVKATGSVTFTRKFGTTNTIVIPQGFRVFVPASAHAPRRDYQTTASGTITTLAASVTLAVEALLVGEAGNTPANTITGLVGKYGTMHYGSPGQGGATYGSVPTGLASVTNLDAITGGILLNVKFPGETIMLFTQGGSLADSAGLDTQKLSEADFLAGLLGADIALTPGGDLLPDARGSLALTRGIDNFKGALLRRFQTPLAWYYYHRAYGSGVPRAIGQRADSYWLQFARLEAERTVRSDPRVANVQNIRAQFASGVLTLTLDILSIGERDPRNLVFSFRVPGG
jgi:hypothetical protein